MHPPLTQSSPAGQAEASPASALQPRAQCPSTQTPPFRQSPVVVHPPREQTSRPFVRSQSKPTGQPPPPEHVRVHRPSTQTSFAPLHWLESEHRDALAVHAPLTQRAPAPPHAR